MPNINEILMKLVVFKYATSLDLSMGYYHIQLSENASTLCMVILQWVKHRCKLLTMVVANSQEIFQ